MSDPSKVETAVLAASTVGMADQIMQAVRDSKDHHPDRAKAHYVKAAIAGAIAIGAFEMLKRDEGLDHHASSHDEHNKHTGGHQSKHEKNEDGHTKDLVAEALGAYALGRQILGHTDHRILKLVAEGLGAVGLAREANRDLT